MFWYCAMICHWTTVLGYHLILQSPMKWKKQIWRTSTKQPVNCNNNSRNINNKMCKQMWNDIEPSAEPQTIRWNEVHTWNIIQICSFADDVWGMTLTHACVNNKKPSWLFFFCFCRVYLCLFSRFFFHSMLDKITWLASCYYISSLLTTVIELHRKLIPLCPGYGKPCLLHNLTSLQWRFL